jgi:hypothetical protein
VTVFEKQTSRFFKFKNIGDTIVGTLVDIGEPRQATKYNPNPDAPRVLDFWESSDGGAPRPKMEVLLTLQTDLREDPDDDGKRKVVIPVFYKDGSPLSAIQAAMFPTGATDLELGAKVGLRFTGHDPDSANPQNPRKLYQGLYERPAAGGGAFQHQPAQNQPAPAAQQPAQQANWQQPGQPAQGGGFGAPAPAQQPGGWEQAPAQNQWAGAPGQQQPAAAQQPVWQDPQHVQAGTGEVTGWQQPAPQQQEWAAPPEAYQPPANPTPQQQQAMAHFPAAAPGWQQPQQQQPAAAPQQQPAPPSSYQVDVALGLIQQGAPDNYISEQSGLSMEAVSALRNR